MEQVTAILERSPEGIVAVLRGKGSNNKIVRYPSAEVIASWRGPEVTCGCLAGGVRPTVVSIAGKACEIRNGKAKTLASLSCKNVMTALSDESGHIYFGGSVGYLARMGPDGDLEENPLRKQECESPGRDVWSLKRLGGKIYIIGSKMLCGVLDASDLGASLLISDEMRKDHGAETFLGDIVEFENALWVSGKRGGKQVLFKLSINGGESLQEVSSDLLTDSTGPPSLLETNSDDLMLISETVGIFTGGKWRGLEKGRYPDVVASHFSNSRNELGLLDASGSYHPVDRGIFE